MYKPTAHTAKNSYQNLLTSDWKETPVNKTVHQRLSTSDCWWWGTSITTSTAWTPAPFRTDCGSGLPPMSPRPGLLPNGTGWMCGASSPTWRKMKIVTFLPLHTLTAQCLHPPEMELWPGFSCRSLLLLPKTPYNGLTGRHTKAVRPNAREYFWRKGKCRQAHPFQTSWGFELPSCFCQQIQPDGRHTSVAVLANKWGAGYNILYTHVRFGHE